MNSDKFQQNQEEFERKLKERIDELDRSIEWKRKRAIKEAQKPEDKYPWMPKNLTQKEMNDWSVDNVDMIELADKTFKDPRQEEQFLRECVILDRDHRGELKRWFRLSLKKYRPDLNKNERDKMVKDIEHNCPSYFKIK